MCVCVCVYQKILNIAQNLTHTGVLFSQDGTFGILQWVKCVFFSRRYFWNIAMGEFDRSFPFNCLPITETTSLHSIRSDNMTNIHSIEKQQLSFFCSACIDQTKSIDECHNQINKFFKLWIHEELTLVPPFGNMTGVEMTMKWL